LNVDAVGGLKGASKGDVIGVENDAADERDDDVAAEFNEWSGCVFLVIGLVGTEAIVVAMDRGPSLTDVNVEAKDGLRVEKTVSGRF